MGPLQGLCSAVFWLCDQGCGEQHRTAKSSNMPTEPTAAQSSGTGAQTCGFLEGPGILLHLMMGRGLSGPSSFGKKS